MFHATTSATSREHPLVSNKLRAAGCLFSHSKKGAALSPFPDEPPNPIAAYREAQDAHCLLGFAAVLKHSPEHPVPPDQPGAAMSRGQCKMLTHQTRTSEGFPKC